MVAFRGELDNGIGADTRKWLAFVISAIAEKMHTGHRDSCWEKSVTIPSKGWTRTFSPGDLSQDPSKEWSMWS